MLGLAKEIETAHISKNMHDNTRLGGYEGRKDFYMAIRYYFKTTAEAWAFMVRAGFDRITTIEDYGVDGSRKDDPYYVEITA